MMHFALLSSPTPQASGPDLVATPTSLATAEAISTIVLAVAVVAVLIVLLLVFLQIRSLAKRIEKQSAPVMERARGVAENVEFITAAVRTDVQKLNESISGLNERLREASLHMEERIQDFSALVEVLQSEAEDLALDTAAAVRGVRAGTKSLAGTRESGAPSGEEEALVLPPETEEAAEKD